MAPSANALVAHVLRRTSFGPSPDRVASFEKAGEAAPAAALDWALSTPPRAIEPQAAKSDDWEPALRGWVSNLLSPDAGLHERMVWFWHGHFATSSAKVGNQLILHNQQRLLREHALGTFPDLLRTVITDPAMLLYLDADPSTVDAPNENLSRELLELFTLGRGNYSELDVKSGALALAGWEVDYDAGTAKFNPEKALGGEVVYLGRRGRLGVNEVVDTICKNNACAPHIANRMYLHFIGSAPQPARLKELADGFRSSGMQIQPLIENILRGEEFLRVRMNRPRFALEWWTAALAAIGPFRDGEDTDVNPWVLEQLDQLPYRPPNVAGWPMGAKWLGASQQLTRAAYVWGISWRMKPIEPVGGTDLVGATLKQCSLFEVSPATRTALNQAALATAGAGDALSVSRRLITTALCSPEFALA